MELMYFHRLSGGRRKVCACHCNMLDGGDGSRTALPQRHDVVEALASDRSDQPFNMTVLPRRTWLIGRSRMPLVRSLP